MKTKTTIGYNSNNEKTVVISTDNEDVLSALLRGDYDETVTAINKEKE